MNSIEKCPVCGEGPVDSNEVLYTKELQQTLSMWCESCGAEWEQVWETKYISTTITKR